MRLLAARFAALASAALLGAGCCSSGPCLDKYSTPDQDRVTANRARLGVVLNDTVSGPKRDRTDWKYVVLAKPGRLEVQLHWDTGAAKLELGIFDVMGIKIQDGRVWGLGGLRCLVAIEEPGRYYIRVRAMDKEDESQYALRILFTPEVKAGPEVCTGCTAGERKCLGSSAYILCEKVGPDCTAWTKTIPCESGGLCKEGMCGACPPESCKPGERRCTDGKQFQICAAGPAGCGAWGADERCPKGKRCSQGDCVRVGETPVHVTPKPIPPEVPKGILKARIISIYKYRGQMTLHLEIGDNPAVRPGLSGTVLEEETSRPLSGGDIRITKVSGRYAIASTSLDKLGKNRWVQIKLQP